MSPLEGESELCPRCGEPLGDYAPCGCALDASTRSRAHRNAAGDGAPSGSMRQMVARKLARQKAGRRA